MGWGFARGVGWGGVSTNGLRPSQKRESSPGVAEEEEAAAAATAAPNRKGAAATWQAARAATRGEVGAVLTIVGAARGGGFLRKRAAAAAAAVAAAVSTARRSAGRRSGGAELFPLRRRRKAGVWRAGVSAVASRCNGRLGRSRTTAPPSGLTPIPRAIAHAAAEASARHGAARGRSAAWRQGAVSVVAAAAAAAVVFNLQSSELVLLSTKRANQIRPPFPAARHSLDFVDLKISRIQ